MGTSSIGVGLVSNKDDVTDLLSAILLLFIVTHLHIRKSGFARIDLLLF